MTATSLSMDRRTATRPSQLSPVSWHPRHELELAHWLEQGRRFGMLGRNVAWWIGDWLLYGNARYGERYPNAAKITGYDVQSLMNMAWVASRFEPSRRREALSWSHHAELAALAPVEQDAWLDQSEAQRMSVRCLRIELRSALRAGRRAEAERETETETEKAHALICPKCGSSVPRHSRS